MTAAFYYDGRSAERRTVRLTVDGGRLRIAGEAVDAAVPLAQVDFGEPLGKGPRVIELPDGARCEVADHAGLARLLAAAGHADGLVARLQARWRWAAAALAAVVAVAAAGYLWGLPAAARALAPHVPATLTQTISDSVLVQLDRQLFRPSELSPAQQEHLRRRAEASLRRAGLPAWRLHFRAASQLGPNALALPAGDIVVLDKLVQLLDERELLAVVAHEIGHVAHRHGMQRLIQGTAVSLVMAAWFGDVSSAAAVLAGQLLQAGYSRGAEGEADRFAARLLDACCGGREALVGALKKLAGHAGDDGPSWFGSHPDTPARIAAIRGLPQDY